MKRPRTTQLNHTCGEVAIVSSRLRGRFADAEAVTGLRATPQLGGSIRVVLTAEGDPKAAEAAAFATAKGAALATLSPHPVRAPELDRRGRPLGYRVTGLELPLLDGAEPGGTRRALDALVRLAPADVLSVAPDFDPDDPALIWLDPYDRRRVTAARAIEIMEDLLRHRSRTARRSFAVGLTRWKRPAAAAFLDGPDGPAVFVRDPAVAADRARAASGRVVAWASRRVGEVEAAALAAGAPFGRLEDGFLRSVGLGSAFVGPLSLVLDESGIYYDPSRPSDLETILLTAEIPASLAARASALRRRLVAANVTKYNVGESRAPVVPAGRFGVLVPGQVADDASILKGAGAVRTDLALLGAARERRPDAFIVYKPHPDVVAGYRQGAAPAAGLNGLADAVVVDGSIAELYPQCRALETITSLSGFEALLRGLEVTTHGQPFYAGWGLTEDLAPHPRRGRARTLDELVAAALILYPLYVDPVSGLPCGPETALDRLVETRARAETGRGRLAARLRHAYALTRHRLLGPIARRLN
jgi:capsular polysaccharide export protein